MGKIYIGQDHLVFFIEAGEDLTNWSSIELQRTDPAGDSASALTIGTVSDVSRGLVTYNVESSDFTTAGTWTLWLHINFTDGSESWGEPFSVNFYTPGI